MSTPDTGTCLGVSASRGGLVAALRRADGEVSTVVSDARAGAMVAEIGTLLRHAGVEAADVDHVVCDVGPGSYTGLRIAVTFARFVAAFGRARVWQMESPALLAAAAWERAGDLERHPLHVLFDARRDRIHHAVVAVDDAGAARTVAGPRCRLRDELQLDAEQAAVALVDDSLRDWFANADTAGRPIAAIDLPAPIAMHLVMPHRVAVTAVSTTDLEPLYLMGSYAET